MGTSQTVMFSLATICMYLVGKVSGMDRYIEDVERFPGWKGELPTQLDVQFDDSVGYSESGKVRCNVLY